MVKWYVNVFPNRTICDVIKSVPGAPKKSALWNHVIQYFTTYSSFEMGKLKFFFFKVCVRGHEEQFYTGIKFNSNLKWKQLCWLRQQIFFLEHKWSEISIGMGTIFSLKKPSCSLRPNRSSFKYGLLKCFFSLLTSVLVSNVGTHLSEIEHFCIQAPWKFKNKANQKSSVSHCFTALWSYVAIWLNMETLNDAENTILLSLNASHNMCCMPHCLLNS